MTGFKKAPQSGPDAAAEEAGAEGAATADLPGIEIVREFYPSDAEALPDAANLFVYALTGFVAVAILLALRRLMRRMRERAE